MLRHALKLAWTRKRASALLIAEFAAVFLVLAGIGMTALRYVGAAREPTGFRYEDVWRLTLSPDGLGERPDSLLRLAYPGLLAVARAQPSVAAVAGIDYDPYGFSNSSGQFDRRAEAVRANVQDAPADSAAAPAPAPEGTEGEPIRFGRNEATDDLPAVLDLKMAHGRWFSRADDGGHAVPVVVNRRFARAYFDREDVVGREVPDFSRERGQPVRVVGVVEEFRQGGEYSTPTPYMFMRDTPAGGGPPGHLLVRAHAGATEADLGALVERLQRAAPGLQVDGQVLDVQRTSFLRLALLPLFAGGLVALFLLVMTALGLVGILWQNLTRRTAELGLRRALGAPRAVVVRQVTAEMLALATFGAVIGLVVALHLPLLGFLDVVSPAVFGGGLALALVVLYAAVAACARYPARAATRLDPAVALRAD